MATKDKVLTLLTDSKEQVISGEALARECGVSRAAVWKAITALRNQGYSIEGSTNGGYVLKDTTDVFTKELFCTYFTREFPRFKDSHIECFKEIDSTNTYAKQLLAGSGSAPHNTQKALSPRGLSQDVASPNNEDRNSGSKPYHRAIIVAEKQTAGRGRMGRVFYSPEKTGIYLSVIYSPDSGIREPAQITAFSAVAVCRAIQKLCGVEPAIKWINDIFIQGKKAGGILTEGFTNFETGIIETAIIGIGINIEDNPEAFPQEVQHVVTSLAHSSGTKVDRCALAAEIAGNTLQILTEDSATVMEEYKRRSFLIGKQLTVYPVIGDEATAYSALVRDIDQHANLVVELADGSYKTLSSGEVSITSAQVV